MQFDYYITFVGSQRAAISAFREDWAALHDSLLCNSRTHLSRTWTIAAARIQAMLAPCYIGEYAGFNVYEYCGRFYADAVAPRSDAACADYFGAVAGISDGVMLSCDNSALACELRSVELLRSMPRDWHKLGGMAIAHRVPAPPRYKNSVQRRIDAHADSPFNRSFMPPLAAVRPAPRPERKSPRRPSQSADNVAQAVVPRRGSKSADCVADSSESPPNSGRCHIQ